MCVCVLAYQSLKLGAAVCFLQHVCGQMRVCMCGIWTGFQQSQLFVCVYVCVNYRQEHRSEREIDGERKRSDCGILVGR